MFTLSEFKTSFNNGVALSNRFTVEITLPDSISMLGGNNRISQLCEVAELPGKSIATGERRTYGATWKTPYNTIYNDFNTTFLCDGKLDIRRVFDDWMDLIHVKKSNNINYLTDYTSTIDILQENDLGKVIRRYSLEDAFPINIESQSLSWSDNDSLLKLNVVFAYRKWNVFDF